MEKSINIFKALADKARLRIYLLLSKGELCVCELVSILNIEQSMISHSLRILKESNLVNSRKQGKWIIYSANSETVKNKIIQGLKKELTLEASDLKNLDKSKKENAKRKKRQKR